MCQQQLANISFFLTSFSPACQHSQVAVWSNGVFQATFPAALEEHHVPQEKQGGHIFNLQTEVKKKVCCCKHSETQSGLIILNICNRFYVLFFSDPAGHRAPLAALPLCHPHLCSPIPPTLQTTPMWVILCNLCAFRHMPTRSGYWLCANQLKRISWVRFSCHTHICYPNLLWSWPPEVACSYKGSYISQHCLAHYTSYYD